MAARTLVIMAPELVPLAKTRLASALYREMVQPTMFAMLLLLVPPSWVREAVDETSQQLPE